MPLPTRRTTITEAGKLRRQPFRERRRVLLVATDPGKARPTGLHRRHRREVHGGLARTGPRGSRSAARYRSGHRAASRVRPRLLSRNSCRGPSISHHDKNNSFFTTTNRSGSLNIIQHVRPLGRSGWYNYYGCSRSRTWLNSFRTDLLGFGLGRR